MPQEPTLMLPVDSLDESPLNPNVVEPERYALLLAGIRANGFLQPILVRPRPDGRHQIADGHHRVRAARELGIAEVPAVVKSMSDDQYAALQLAMNKLRGEVDLSRASAIMVDLATRWEVPDLAITGFTVGEVEALLAMAEAPEDPMSMAAPDEAAPSPDEGATTKIFDLTIVFTNRDDYTLARKRLKKAAGKGGDLAAGLLKLLGEGQTTTTKETT